MYTHVWDFKSDKNIKKMCGESFINGSLKDFGLQTLTTFEAKRKTINNKR